MAKPQSKVSRPNDPQAEESQTRMSFGEHLDELRKRVMRALLGSVFGCGLCLLYVKQIILYIVEPYRRVLHNHGYPEVFSYTNPAEPFMSYLSFAFQAGLILSSPWIIYQIWAFVGAGLYKKERKIVYRYIGPSAALFLLGVLFFFYVVLPLTLNFFVGYTEGTSSKLPPPGWLERTLQLISEASPGAATTTTTPAPATTAVATTAATTTATAPATTSAATTTTTTAATIPFPGFDFSNLPDVTEDPPTPPPGVARFFYNSTEAKLKLQTHERTQIIQLVLEGSLLINTPGLKDYLSFVQFTALIFGLAFELPMVIMILAQIGIVPVKTFRGIRKYAYFTLVVLAAFIAPSGDLLTMLCLLLPMIALYELGIIAGAVVTRGRTDD